MISASILVIRGAISHFIRFEGQDFCCKHSPLPYPCYSLEQRDDGSAVVLVCHSPLGLTGALCGHVLVYATNKIITLVIGWRFQLQEKICLSSSL